MKIVWIFILALNSSISHAFPSAPVIDQQVWFWEQIFTTFHNKQIVIHDSENPEIIVDVVDLPNLNFKGKKDEERWISELQDRYQEGVDRFVKNGSRAYLLGAIERRLYKAYGESKRKDLLKGEVKLRTQRGLKDIFDRAIQRSSSYLPEMERIFRRNGLPRELTRVPFVESMFNVEARSKVGASGIWQFMPATARRFMTVNHFIDERNSPLKATEGAAQLLKYNYQELGNWPLAITAYNHGLYGMKRAIRATKSKRLSVMIDRYKGRTFGFASRNFYGEFLAARRVYEAKMKNEKAKHRALPVAKVVLKKPVTPARLLTKTSLSRSELQSLNRCMNDSLFRKGYHKPLPRNFSFWVPKNKAKKVKTALARL